MPNLDANAQKVFSARKVINMTSNRPGAGLKIYVLGIHSCFMIYTYNIKCCTLYRSRYRLLVQTSIEMRVSDFYLSFTRCKRCKRIKRKREKDRQRRRKNRQGDK